MSVLARILEAKRAELPALRVRRLASPPPRRAVTLARSPGAPLALIAEFKRRSPSAGVLSPSLGIEDRVRAYARGGARMISVLTDPAFFDGRYEDLAAARAACELPLLCKEFVIDEVQLDCAAAFGADAVLLIVRCLEPARLGTLMAAARERDLVPLVEVHTEAEATLALSLGASFIGVNARDLDTLTMDVPGAARVLRGLPANVTRAHLSGLATAEQVAEVARSGADVALIGEALMRREDPEPLLRELARAGAATA